VDWHGSNDPKRHNNWALSCDRRVRRRYQERGALFDCGGKPGHNAPKELFGGTSECPAGMRWWDWPAEKIAQHASLLCSENIEEFIRVGGLLAGDESKQAAPSGEAVLGT